MTLLASLLPRNPSRWVVSNVIVPVGLLFAAWYAVGDLMSNPLNLPGFDTYWHVTFIDEGMSRFRANQPIGPIAESISGGSQYLYDTNSSYPQFAYWVSIVVGLVVGNAGTAFAFMIFAAVAIAQLSFYIGFRSRFGIFATVIGSLAYGYAPFFLTTIAPQGRLPALLAVATLPAILAGTLALMEKPSRVVWFWTVIAVGLSAAFHPMVFYIAAVPIGAIGVLHAIVVKAGPKRIALSASASVVGVLVIWIALPDAISDLSVGGGVVGTATVLEGAGIRAGTGSNATILPFSIRENSFFVGLRGSNENYAGVGIVAAALLALVLVRRRDVVVFALGAILAYVLATGSLTPLWEKIPLAAALEPRRFLFRHI